MHKDYDKYIHRISLETRLPVKVIKEIVDSPFSFMREKIPKMVENEEFKNFRVINLGIFYTNERILNKLKSKKNEDTDGV